MPPEIVDRLTEVERTLSDPEADTQRPKKRKGLAAPPDQTDVRRNKQKPAEPHDWITVIVAWSNFVRQLDELHGLVSSMTKSAHDTLRAHESKSRHK